MSRNHIIYAFKLTLTLVLATFLNGNAQGVQWASKVLAFSSEKIVENEPRQYKAPQILGKPNVLPSFQSSPCAWSPKTKDNNFNEEFIKVGFDKPMEIKQIAIAENFNAGSVSQIYGYDEAENPYLLYKNPNVAAAGAGRMFLITIPKTAFKVAALKVMLNTAKVAGENQIDAIGISDDEKLIEATINPLSTKIEMVSKVEMLDANINSPYQETSPHISPDGKTLYFTRYDHPENIPIKDVATGIVSYRQDVWYAQIKPDNSFTKAKPIGSAINNKFHNASFGITTDDRILLNNIYVSDTSMAKGLSFSKKIDSVSWAKPLPLAIEGIDNLSEFAEAYLSSDGNILIMALKGNDSFGSKDLYVALRTGSNSFGKPINLGKNINTAGLEASPFLSSDNKTLYFASEGYSGYGKLDIFMAKRKGDSWTEWSEPQNVGSEINTPNSDLFFSISAKGDYIFYSSNKDIYRIKIKVPNPITVLRVKSFDNKTKEPLATKIIIEKLPEIKKETTTEVKKDEEYKITLGAGQKYRITAEAQGYFPVSTDLDVTVVKDYTEIKKELYLKLIEKNETLRLSHISFARAQSDLLPDSYPELDKLVDMLNQNPTIKIRLEGHTEVFGNRKALTNLSKERVIAVKNYLTKKGINPKRVTYKAYGPDKPLTTKDTEEDRQMNRRVEVKVI